MPQIFYDLSDDYCQLNMSLHVSYVKQDPTATGGKQYQCLPIGSYVGILVKVSAAFLSCADPSYAIILGTKDEAENKICMISVSIYHVLNHVRFLH